MKFLLLLLASILEMTTSVAHAKICSNSDGIKAEEATDHLNSWPDIRAAFVRYAPQCDDGGVAEGFSDDVVHLLATNWRALSELDAMTKKDGTFKKFVLGHINASTDLNELRMIAQQSKDDCSKKYKPLCKQLNEAALQAINE